MDHHGPVLTVREEVSKPGEDGLALRAHPVSRYRNVVVSRRREVLELSRDQADRRAHRYDVQSLRRAHPLPGGGEPTVGAGVAVRFGPGARDEQQHGLRRGRAIPLEEAPPEPRHLGPPLRFEDHVVVRAGPGHRGPFVEERTEVVVRVTEHLREGGLRGQARLHEFPKAVRPRRGACLDERPSIRVDGMDRKVSGPTGGARGAGAQRLGDGRRSVERTEHRVEILASRRGEQPLGGIDEVHAQVDEKRHPMGERDARCPEHRVASVDLADVAQRRDERPAVRPQRSGIPEHEELGPHRGRGRGGLGRERRVHDGGAVPDGNGRAGGPHHLGGEDREV